VHTFPLQPACSRWRRLRSDYESPLTVYRLSVSPTRMLKSPPTQDHVTWVLVSCSPARASFSQAWRTYNALRSTTGTAFEALSWVVVDTKCACSPTAGVPAEIATDCLSLPNGRLAVALELSNSVRGLFEGYEYYAAVHSILQ
jgi:hypothetical protein